MTVKRKNQIGISDNLLAKMISKVGRFSLSEIAKQYGFPAADFQTAIKLKNKKTSLVSIRHPLYKVLISSSGGKTMGGSRSTASEIDRLRKQYRLSVAEIQDVVMSLCMDYGISEWEHFLTPPKKEQKNVPLILSYNTTYADMPVAVSANKEMEFLYQCAILQCMAEKIDPLVLYPLCCDLFQRAKIKHHRIPFERYGLNPIYTTQIYLHVMLPYTRNGIRIPELISLFRECFSPGERYLFWEPASERVHAEYLRNVGNIFLFREALSGTLYSYSPQQLLTSQIKQFANEDDLVKEK